MNYTEIIEQLNSLNGWVLISVIVSVAAGLLAAMCIRTFHETHRKTIEKITEINSSLRREREKNSVIIYDIKQKSHELESLIKEKQNGNN